MEKTLDEKLQIKNNYCNEYNEILQFVKNLDTTALRVIAHGFEKHKAQDLEDRYQLTKKHPESSSQIKWLCEQREDAFNHLTGVFYGLIAYVDELRNGTYDYDTLDKMMRDKHVDTLEEVFNNTLETIKKG